MKVGEIFSRLFFVALGAICGVEAYFICPLVGEVESNFVKQVKEEASFVSWMASDELMAVTDKGTHHISYVANDDSIRWKPYVESALVFKSSPGMSLLYGAKKLDLYF